MSNTLRRAGLALLVLGVVVALVAPGASARQDDAPFRGQSTRASNPLAVNDGFSVAVEAGAFLSGGTTEGAVLIGGDLVLRREHAVAATSPGQLVVGRDARPSSLVVGGRVEWEAGDEDARLTVLRRSYVKIADLTESSVIVGEETTTIGPSTDTGATPRIETRVRQPQTSVGADPGIDFDTLFATHRSQADALAACVGTLTMRDPDGAALTSPFAGGAEPVVRVEPTEGIENVLNLTGRDLLKIRRISFVTPPSAEAPVVINIDTTDLDHQLTWDVVEIRGVNAEATSYLLFNFADARRLALLGDQQLEGTVYAPRASVALITEGGLAGGVVARRFHQGTSAGQSGAVVDRPFAGAITGCGLGRQTPTSTSTATGPTATPVNTALPPSGTGTPSVSPTVFTATPTGSASPGPTSSPTARPTSAPQPTLARPTSTPRATPTFAPGKGSLTGIARPNTIVVLNDANGDVVAQASSDASGRWLMVGIDSGLYWLTETNSDNVVLVYDVTVIANETTGVGAGSGQLPKSGSNTSRVMSLGLSFLLIGAAITVVASVLARRTRPEVAE